MLKIPQAYLNASIKKVEAKAETPKPAAKVEARIDMSAEVAGAGLCPECRQPMDRANANGIPVWICEQDRIAIPIADESEAPKVV